MSDPSHMAEVPAALRELADALAPDPVVLLGASALRFHRPTRARNTLDVDVAVGAEAHVSRLPAGWTRSAAPHRWVSTDGLPIDLVPATDDDLRRGHVEWPDGSRMSLVGVDLVLRDAIRYSPSGPDNLLVASLLGIFVCKVVAFGERPGDRIKDLGDLALMLESYVEIDDPRFCDDAAFDGDATDDITFEDRAAFLLGVDLRHRCADHHRRAVESFIADVSRPDSRERGLLLREATRVGAWSEALLESRFRALHDGLSTRR